MGLNAINAGKPEDCPNYSSLDPDTIENLKDLNDIVEAQQLETACVIREESRRSKESLLKEWCDEVYGVMDILISV